MFAWILAFALAAAAWTIAILHVWLVRRRDDETRAGLNALAGLHWREFAEIVRRALGDQRGWRAPLQAHADGLPRADFLMHDEQAGGDRLVSCKHGRAYRIGAVAVSELGTALRLAGALGGVLVTEGKVEREGLAAAEKQSIEVLDGRRVWPLLKPYLPSETETRIVRGARRRALRHIGIAGLASITLGLLAGLGWLSWQGASPPPRPAVARAPASAPAPAASAPPGAPAGSPAPAAQPATEAEPDEATLDRYQHEVSRALAGTPGVIRGIWLTRTTLAVDRSGEDAQVWPSICRQLERHPVLRTVRVQLNPRIGVDEPVRWRQCATF